MNQEMIDKINEMLGSENSPEVELGRQMIRTWVEENQPCNIPLVEDQLYLVSYLSQNKWIERYRFKFKRMVFEYYYQQERHMLQFEYNIRIEVNKIVKIVPA
jgi:hypothetical protein